MIKWTTELFINKAKELNSNIDYSKTLYTKNKGSSTEEPYPFIPFLP